MVTLIRNMATYVPATLITMTNLAASCSKQNTGPSGTFDVHRTIVVSSSAGATININQRTTNADSSLTRILTSSVVAASVPKIIRLFIPIPTTEWINILAASGTASGASYGYFYS